MLEFELSFEVERFREAIDRYVDTFKKDIEEEIRRLALSLLVRVKARTPVLTGRLQNSWHTVLPGEHDTYVYSNNLGQTFDGSMGVSAEDGLVVEGFVGTNVPYAIYIEAGHSRKAPTGMLAISVAEMTGELEAAVERALKGKSF